MRKPNSRNLRQTIIDVATQLFLEYGYYDMKWGMLAHALDINLGRIYYYYKNKKDLFNDCFPDYGAKAITLFENKLDFKEGQELRLMLEFWLHSTETQFVNRTRP